MTKIKSFRLPNELLEKLEQIAKQDRRTLTNLVIKILSDFTDKKVREDIKNENLQN